MYKRVHVTHVPNQSYTLAFLLGRDAITIRVFEQISGASLVPGAASTSPEESHRYLMEHADPLYLMGQFAKPERVIDGADFGRPGALFRRVDSMRVERNPDLFGVGVNSDRCVLMVCTDHSTGKLLLPFNRTSMTLLERENRYAMYRQLNANSVLTIGNDFAADSWLDAQVFVKYNQTLGGAVFFDADVVGTKPKVWPPGQSPVYDPPATLRLSGPDSVEAGGNALFTVESVHGATGAILEKTATVYIEPVYGYAPKQRVELVDGRATFEMLALGLKPGDTVRVKVGFRFTPGLDDASVQVV
jgi:hypothetical protein